jgi:RNA polymerase sigma factor (sigma-70 family)
MITVMDKKKKAMDDATATKVYEWCIYVARRYYYYCCNAVFFDMYDLASAGFLRALKVYPEWDKNKGTLSTFLIPYITGAVKDEIRNYTKSRHDDDVYRDYETIRFSNMEYYNHLEYSINDMLEDKSLRHDLKMEIKDELAVWSKKVTRKLWLIMFLRYGHCMSQRTIAETIGMSPCSISIILNKLEKVHGIKRVRIDYEKKPKKKKKKNIYQSKHE